MPRAPLRASYTDARAAHEIEELKRESEALKKIREAVGTEEFPKMLFDKVFNADVERLRSVEDMWKSRRAPEPLQYEALLSKAGEAAASKDGILANGQGVWSLEESLIVFNDSLDRLSKRLLELKKLKDPSGPEPIITFDKDDEDTLDFVAASANIRSTIFGIDRKSRFDIKQMAGNIIPAIATTNAIVAGLSVLQSFKVLKGDYAQAKEVMQDALLFLFNLRLTASQGVSDAFRFCAAPCPGPFERAKSELPSL
jgi:ubiquitin-like 1-activating enzyme E1 B